MINKNRTKKKKELTAVQKLERLMKLLKNQKI